MGYLRILALLGICLGSASFAHAQRVIVGVGVGPAYVGPAPVCAYGYYGYYPYACAPYGYYGPDYFVGGVFIGAGPWFHGRSEEHTSELQSHSDLVCRLLLEKKKKQLSFYG